MATRVHPTTTGAFAATPKRALTLWAIFMIVLGTLPVSAVWAVGTLLGVNLIMSGVALLMFSASLRRELAAPVPA